MMRALIDTPLEGGLQRRRFTKLAQAVWFAELVLPLVPPASAFVVDMELRAHFADGALMQGVGYTSEMVVGHRIPDVMSLDAWSRVQPFYERILAGEYFEVEYAGTNGGLYVMHGAPVVDTDGIARGGLLVVLEAVTRSEDRLSQRLRQQSAVAELGRIALAGDQSAMELIDHARRRVSKVLGPCGVIELLADRRHFRVHMDSGDSLSGKEFPVAGSLVERAIRLGKPVVFPDAGVAAFPPELAEIGFRSAASVLIGHADSPLGGLGVFSTSPYEFDQDDVVFLESIANVLAGAMRREHSEQAARTAVQHDAVTGLADPGLLEERLRQSLRFAERAGMRVGVLFVDLDRFGAVNDSLGHEGGDAVLQAVAARLESVVRGADTVARMSSDEFVLVLNGLESAHDAIRCAQTALQMIAAPIMVGGREVHMRASIGIALSSDAPADPKALVLAADAAKSQAKTLGRNRVHVHDPAGEQAVDTLRVAQDLRHAVGDAQLRLAFQPFVHLDGRRAFGAEVLLRWEHPRQGLVGPSFFLDVAEQTGLIVPIGEWMLGEACAHAARWSRDGDFLVTVNLSASQLSDPGIVDAVRRALADTGLPPEALGLELTEQVLIYDEDAVFATLAALKALGVRLLLDDFGTGYSSLSHLKRFPIDTVKIDRSFIDGLDGADSAERTDDAAIVAAIVGMGSATDKLVIAEGVETAGQAECLRKMGCRLGQGYLFARPMESSDFEAWMQAHA